MPNWKEGGQCRIVCRPNRKEKRCFTPADVKRIIRYALECSDKALICAAIGEVITCDCERPAECDELQKLLDEAIDYLIEVAGNEGIIELRALLGWILDHPPPDPGGQLRVAFLPAWVSRAWSLLQYAWFLYRLYRLAQEVIDVIDLLNPTLDLLREVQTLVGGICDRTKQN